MPITINVSNWNATIVSMEHLHSWLEFLGCVGLWCQEVPGAPEGLSRVESTQEASLAGGGLTGIAGTAKHWQPGQPSGWALRTTDGQEGSPESLSLQQPREGTKLEGCVKLSTRPSYFEICSFNREENLLQLLIVGVSEGNPSVTYACCCDCLRQSFLSPWG